MRDTYKPGFWWMDYAPGKEEDIDPTRSDKALEKYIERRRREFHEDWNEYLAKFYE